jgi:ATP phosphoribosyltransferase
LESDVYEPLDLQIGKCKLSLAGPDGIVLSREKHLSIATKYPRTADRFFKSRRAHVRIVRLEGSVEIAPALGLADAIVDLVETGRTLRDNDLRIIEDITPVSAKMIVNRAAMKTKARRVNNLISKLDAVIYENT